MSTYLMLHVWHILNGSSQSQWINVGLRGARHPRCHNIRLLVYLLPSAGNGTVQRMDSLD